MRELKLGARGERPSGRVSIPTQVCPILKPVLFLVPAHSTQGSQESLCRGSWALKDGEGWKRMGKSCVGWEISMGSSTESVHVPPKGTEHNIPGVAQMLTCWNKGQLRSSCGTWLSPRKQDKVVTRLPCAPRVCGFVLSGKLQTATGTVTVTGPCFTGTGAMNRQCMASGTSGLLGGILGQPGHRQLSS